MISMWLGAGAGTRLNDQSLRVADRDNLSGARIAGPKVLLENPPLALQGMVNAGYIRSLAPAPGARR